MNVISCKSLVLFVLACCLFFTNSLAVKGEPEGYAYSFKVACLKKLGCIPGLGTVDINKDVNARKLQKFYDKDMQLLKNKYAEKHQASSEFIASMDEVEAKLRGCQFDRACEEIYQIIQLKKCAILHNLKMRLDRLLTGNCRSCYRPGNGNIFIQYGSQFKEFFEKFKLPEGVKKLNCMLSFINGMREKALNFINSIDKMDKRLPVVQQWMDEYFQTISFAGQEEQEKIAIKQRAIAKLPKQLMCTLPKMTNEIYNEILCYNKACFDILKQTMTNNPISVEEANNQMLAEKVVFLQKPRVQFNNNEEFRLYYKIITAIQTYYQNNSAKPEIIDAVISMQSNTVINQLKENLPTTPDIFEQYKPMIVQFIQGLNIENYQTTPQEYFAEFLQRMQEIPETVQGEFKSDNIQSQSISKSNYVAPLPKQLMCTLPKMTNEIYNEILCYNKACFDILKQTMTNNPISVEEANNQMLAEKLGFLGNPRVQFNNNEDYRLYCKIIMAIQAYYQNHSAKPEIIDAVISMQSNIFINQLRKYLPTTPDIFEQYKPMIVQFIQELNFENYQTTPQGYCVGFLKRMQEIPKKVQGEIKSDNEIRHEAYWDIFPENKPVDDCGDIDCFSLDLE